jgi:WhiB family redox-sensing transcriptional regulator
MDDWREQANCRDMDPALFFAEAGGNRMGAEAKTACDNCYVQVDCLQWALEHEDYGWWANTSENERRKMRKRLNIGLTPVSFVPTNRGPVCGTPQGYQKHSRDRTPACDDCKCAWARKRQGDRAS